MDRWARRCALAALVWGVTVGCANVKVNKVDVQARIEGQDHHVHGFRYYLTRPYIVVSRRVPVSTTYVPVALAVFPADAAPAQGQPLPPGSEIFLVAQVPDEQGAYRVYDRTGHWRPDLTPSAVRVLPSKTRPDLRKQPPPAQIADVEDAIELVTGQAVKKAAAEGKIKLTQPEERALRTAIRTATARAKKDLGAALTAKSFEEAGARAAIEAGRRFLNDRVEKLGEKLDARAITDAVAAEVRKKVAPPIPKE